MLTIDGSHVVPGNVKEPVRRSRGEMLEEKEEGEYRGGGELSH